MDTIFKQKIDSEILKLECEHVKAIKMKYFTAQAEAEALRERIKMLEDDLQKLL